MLDRAELRLLLQRLADGDRTAFRPAFAMLWPQLRSFAVRFAGEDDGEDAAQAAILKVFSHASEYDGERDAVAWAIGIAAWECRTLRKRRERRRETSALAPAPAAADPSPEDAAIERDLRRAAESVLGMLRPIDIETIAAAAAGRRAEGATFRKRLERALARFRLAWRARHGNE